MEFRLEIIELHGVGDFKSPAPQNDREGPALDFRDVMVGGQAPENGLVDRGVGRVFRKNGDGEFLWRSASPPRRVTSRRAAHRS